MSNIRGKKVFIYVKYTRLKGLNIYQIYEVKRFNIYVKYTR